VNKSEVGGGGEGEVYREKKKDRRGLKKDKRTGNVGASTTEVGD